MKLAHISIYQHKELLERLTVNSDLETAISIGKEGHGAVIDLPSTFISRQHATICVEAEQYLILKDLDSTNGTFINKLRIEEQELKDKDIISFGGNDGYRMEIELLEATVPLDTAAKETIVVPKKGRSSVVFSTPLGNWASDIEVGGKTSANWDELLEAKGQITIGRSKDADIRLQQLTITRLHASIQKKSDGTYTIKDLGSKNGTFVNGKRINKEAVLTPKDVVNVGAYSFRLLKPAEDIRKRKAIVAEGISKVVDNGKITILRDISFKIPAQEFVAIMGPSGCGKSTLLRALNGDFPATSGKVFIHNMELYANYDYLKRLIGYVPQDDIVHKELTVEASLFYAAKLRLSSDVSKEDIEEKINEVLFNLNIADKDIRQRKIGDLSGGQRKRVSIAVELLTDPSILFLDEPTSPLDPETIADFLSCLQSLAEKGTTILMVTHKPSDLDYVDKVIFLSKGGYMTYYGGKNKTDFCTFFEAENVIEVYAKNRTLEDGQRWASKFRGLNQHSGSIAKGTTKIQKTANEPFLKQLYWLILRYFNIKTNDRLNTLILLAQAPIIASLVALIFGELELSVLFLMSISAIWFGTNNAAKEIVGELAIYRRERMFNLRIFPYLLSKILVLTFFSILQVLVFVGIVYLLVGNEELKMQHYWQHVGVMCYLSFSATLLGLLVSAWVNNTEKVMTIVPIVLIPQIMLAGVITAIPKKSVVEYVSYGMISRWGTESFAYVQDSIRAFSTLPSEPDSLIYSTVDAVEFLNLPRTIGLYPELAANMWAITAINFVVFLMLWWVMKSKDSV